MINFPAAGWHAVDLRQIAVDHHAQGAHAD
jgi:hypothetical protein